MNIPQRPVFPEELRKPFSNITKQKYLLSESFYTVRKKAVRIPKHINPELAYFIGYLQGDGHIGLDRKRVSFADEYREQMVQLNHYTKTLFGISGIIREKYPSKHTKASYALEINSNVLNEYLVNQFQLPRGRKKGLSIPPQIRRSKSILKWYLVGLYDADGTLPKNHYSCKQWFLDITMKDKQMIQEIKDVLKEVFAIETLRLYKRVAKSPHSDTMSETWELRIRRHSQILRFLKEIGFAHPDKHRRMVRILNEPVA